MGTKAETIINVITIIFLLIFISMLSFLVTFVTLSMMADETILIEPVQTNESSILNKTNQPIPTLLDCQYKTGIQERMECVNNYVKSIFIYKIRPDKEIITRTQLITKGGDCGNWADFYIDVGRELGYDGETFSFCYVEKNEEKAICHRIAFVFNNKAYCKLDQTDIDCFKYGTVDKTEINNTNKTEVI